MEKNLGEFIQGRKTFFICPDQTLFPAHYLEDFLVEGYETYFIENDKLCSIPKKIEILMDIFKDSIFFFNIDARIPDLEWPVYLKQLQKRIDPRIMIGVTYLKRTALQERLELEKLYLYDIGLQSGCVQMEYRKNANFAIIEKILYANQAMGHRKFVRALCEQSSTISFIYNGTQYDGKLADLSLSHFSCTFAQFCPVKQYEKISSIQLKIKGMVIRTDAVLFMQRMTENGMLFIFAFTNKQGGNGLDSYVQQMLIPKIYGMMADNFKSIVYPLFENLSLTVSVNSGQPISKQLEQQAAAKLFEELTTLDSPDSL